MEYDSEAACARRKSSSSSGEPRVHRFENNIYFSDRITYESAHDFNILIRVLERDILDDVDKVEAALKKEKTKYSFVKIEPRPIKIHITTHGGIVHAAFSIVDTILSLRVPVYTYVDGYVASAGTLISLAGTKRFIRPNAFMMIHEVRGGFWGKFSDHVVEHTNITKLMDHIIKYYIERFAKPITKEKLLEMLRHDNDLSAAECVELGLVDTLDN